MVAYQVQWWYIIIKNSISKLQQHYTNIFQMSTSRKNFLSCLIYFINFRLKTLLELNELRYIVMLLSNANFGLWPIQVSFYAEIDAKHASLLFIRYRWELFQIKHFHTRGPSEYAFNIQFPKIIEYKTSLRYLASLESSKVIPPDRGSKKS